uniref:Uncharacterized protein n=1 Tax=Mycena chlorophos TaxID=658473 RepID=A0ABQ0LCJ4_MYCCL|nr:predicted protein [Mycena chlorophos]
MSSPGKLNLPTQLRTLKLLSDRDFIDVHIDESRDPCSLLMSILFLRFSASSLTQLTINPHSSARYANMALRNSSSACPSLTALTQMTFHIGSLGGDTYASEVFFASFTANTMPRLTTLRFVSRIQGEDDEAGWFSHLFQSRARELHADSLRVKFPSLQTIVWALRAATYAFRTTGTVPELARTVAYRETMERGLLRRLEEVGMGDAERLRSLVVIEWLDPMYRPLN